MKAQGAEIVCVGTEMLLGEIVNTNAAYLAKALAELGIPHYYQTVVGDNRQRIHGVLALATSRSQVVLFTGGLGPTPDDLTTEAIAEFFGVPLVEHPELWPAIAESFARRGRSAPENNRKQTFLPAGAAVLPNPVGTAPGMIWEPQPGLLILTFPGVPAEMQAMWTETAVPELVRRGLTGDRLHSRILHYWGISESALAEKVQPFLDLADPTVAPYASKGQVRLRLTTRGKTPTAASAVIDPVAAQILALTGEHCFGQDDDTLVKVVARRLQERRETLAVAESCTGGGLGQALTAEPGSSAYFLGGIIAYSNEVKVRLLGVRPETLAQHGAVSAPVAAEMAVGVRERLGSDWAIALTGIAGPGGGTPEKPVGTVWIGIAGADGVQTHVETLGDRRGRDWVRQTSILAALDRLRRRLA
ncbi:MAG: competence/damage-inducible protein A [Pseudanabaenaceae cyanobacterium]